MSAKIRYILSFTELKFFKSSLCVLFSSFLLPLSHINCLIVISPPLAWTTRSCWWCIMWCYRATKPQLYYWILCASVHLSNTLIARSQPSLSSSCDDRTFIVVAPTLLNVFLTVFKLLMKNKHLEINGCFMFWIYLGIYLAMHFILCSFVWLVICCFVCLLESAMWIKVIFL